MALTLLKRMFTLTLLLLSGFSYAQDLREMPEKERNKILIEEAKRAVMKHGSGFYREYKTPKIALATDEDVKMSIAIYESTLKLKREIASQTVEWVKDVAKGRRWYTVTIGYDQEKEHFVNGYAAQVYIWTDTHKAFRITFGNRYSVFNIDKPLKKDEKIKVIEYEKCPPLKK